MQAVGNGGLGGSIQYPALANAVKAGYAAAGTDTGHVGGNADFVVGHPEKLVDFAYRAIHEMTVTAKTVRPRTTTRAPARVVFQGVLTGGRQALIEAQRYPGGFRRDRRRRPVVGSDAALCRARRLNVYMNREPAAVIPPSKYPMIHNAVLAACDTQDGVKDGVIENPARCSFDLRRR